MVTTSQKSVIDTQERKESKHNTKDSHQITMEENKRTRKEQKELQKQIQNSEQKSNMYLHINNCSKCKWTKCSNRKT